MPQCRSALLAALILGAGFAVMLGLGLPGQLSYDSVTQLLDGRTGAYNSWHPAAMDWLLGLFDSLWRGTALFVIFQAALLALALGLGLRRRSGWTAAAVALGIVATPQFLLYQSTVWKDVLLADAALAAFAALARATREEGAVRAALLSLFFAALSLAALMRQNALVLLPAGALACGWAGARGSRRRGLALGAAALALLLALTIGASLLLGMRGDGGEGVDGEIRLAQTYDLTGAVRRGYRLTRLAHSDPALAGAIAQKGVAAWSPRMMDTLEPALGLLVHTAPQGAIMAEWRHLVLQAPGTYLAVRLTVFWQVLATPDVALCHPAFAGVEGDPADLKALGLAPRQRPQDRGLATYARAFMGTPVFSHLAFGLLAAALLIFYLVRRRPGDIAMAGLLTGALVFAASFLADSVACDYRYLYLLDMAAMLALFYGATGQMPR